MKDKNICKGEKIGHFCKSDDYLGSLEGGTSLKGIYKGNKPKYWTYKVYRQKNSPIGISGYKEDTEVPKIVRDVIYKGL